MAAVLYMEETSSSCIKSARQEQALFKSSSEENAPKLLLEPSPKTTCSINFRKAHLEQAYLLKRPLQGLLPLTLQLLQFFLLRQEQQELFHENSIRLAAKETKLMEYLMLNEGKKLSTSEILTHVWNGESTDEKIVWMYVNFLRSKLDSINADITIDGQQGGSYVLSTLAGGNIA